jgi:anti-anti-sigma factor
MSTTSSGVTGLPQLHIGVHCPSPMVARVVVVGEVDLTTAAVLGDGLLRVLDEQAPAVIHVDLAGVAFLDCTGIDALVAVYNRAVRSGCSVRVLHPQPIVRRVLEVTGVVGLLTAPIGVMVAAGRQACGVAVRARAERRLGAAPAGQAAQLGDAGRTEHHRQDG